MALLILQNRINQTTQPLHQNQRHRESIKKLNWKNLQALHLPSLHLLLRGIGPSIILQDTIIDLEDISKFAFDYLINSGSSSSESRSMEKKYRRQKVEDKMQVDSGSRGVHQESRRSRERYSNKVLIAYVS